MRTVSGLPSPSTSPRSDPGLSRFAVDAIAASLAQLPGVGVGDCVGVGFGDGEGVTLGVLSAEAVADATVGVGAGAGRSWLHAVSPARDRTRTITTLFTGEKIPRLAGRVVWTGRRASEI
jgi:hypothetical protein